VTSEDARLRERAQERLLERAAEQRAMVRWWAAECRQRNAACRRRFSAANVAAASEARAILRDYARAWSRTRALLHG
jgi:hypothetical protein